MTLRRLLLIFPAYLLGIMMADWWETHTVRTEYHYFQAINDIRSADLQLEYVQETFGPKRIETQVIDQWLDGSLPANDPLWSFFEQQGPDPWGNPYRFVRDRELQDGTRVPIGVYSTGRDGISRSQGNDPDDLNSWDEHTGSFYRAEISADNRKRFAIQGLFLAPFTYIALLVVCSLHRRFVRHRSPEP